MRRMIREPLFQFAALAVGLFVLFELQGTSDTPEVSPKRIEVTDTEIARLSRQFAATWSRPPVPGELATLVDSYIAEEILVREALKLGMDRGDAVIRARLRQKMIFIAESAAQTLEPEESVLAAHLAENVDRFAQPDEMSFEQIYLGQAPTETEVAEVHADLAEGLSPSELGERTLLPFGMADSTPSQIDRVFGLGFFSELYAAPDAEWVGPVPSGYGQHLVRVSDRAAGAVPSLAAIRDDVLADWRRMQLEALAEAQLAQMTASYDIIRPSDADLLRVLSQ